MTMYDYVENIPFVTIDGRLALSTQSLKHRREWHAMPSHPETKFQLGILKILHYKVPLTTLLNENTLLYNNEIFPATGRLLEILQTDIYHKFHMHPKNLINQTFLNGKSSLHFFNVWKPLIIAYPKTRKKKKKKPILWGFGYNRDEKAYTTKGL